MEGLRSTAGAWSDALATYLSVTRPAFAYSGGGGALPGAGAPGGYAGGGRVEIDYDHLAQALTVAMMKHPQVHINGAGLTDLAGEVEQRLEGQRLRAAYGLS